MTKQNFSFTRSALCCAITITLGSTLASCGGDDSGSSHASTDKEHSVLLDNQRIEPKRTKSGESYEKQVFPALPVSAATTLTLPPLEIAKSMLAEPQEGQPLHIGTVREVNGASPDETADALLWQDLGNGAKAASLRFVSPDAEGIRLAVDVQALPDGAVLRFYGDDGEDAMEVAADEAASWRAVNEEAGLNAETARLVWSQTIDGSAATLEIEIPAGAAPNDVVIAVPKLSHLILSLQQAEEKSLSDIGNAGSCHANVTCESDSLGDESRAVAKMTFNNGSGTYLCTGTLINDASSSGTPHFITASHCIKTPEAAASLETQWFFRAWKCERPQAVITGGKGKTEQLVGGAQLLFTSDTYDTTLLKLNKKPPSGVVYAGSYYGNALQKIDGILGIHHPKGDLQKYSVGRIVGYASCNAAGCIMEMPMSITDPDPVDPNPSSYNRQHAPMFGVGWLTGTTETGSNGSAMFVRDAETGTRYLAGVLHSGGTTSCSHQTGFDFYGRFGLAYKAGIEKYLQ